MAVSQCGLAADGLIISSIRAEVFLLRTAMQDSGFDGIIKSRQSDSDHTFCLLNILSNGFTIDRDCVGIKLLLDFFHHGRQPPA